MSVTHRIHLHNHDRSHSFGFWEADYWLEITDEGELTILKETGPSGSASVNPNREKLDPTRWSNDLKEKALKAINGLEMSPEVRDHLIQKLSG
jgi:hypothetical protein